ncbi:methyltransferase domain-containing protein [Hazenella coriacea]|uniref:Malonyl-CoA O-methyltransferase n=1 Tax=Hazenella coriacea TaxID=1179467 RepID=A0A4R3L8D7_9BACL|nr:methyltransferase domain-containing protein [Hazenella coriacea]TCS95832.1 malonyl-CoA O-methyltransferase [Hazenella coriacea]
MNKKERLIRHMNRSVRTYDEYADVHRKLAHRLLLSVKEKVACAGRILEIGCGTGYLTQLLVDHFPQATIIAIDFAEQMIQMAKEKIQPPSRVRLLVENAEKLDIQQFGTFDLVITNSTLQWLDYPQKAIADWYDLLKPGGWLFATAYGPDMLYELRTILSEVELDLGLEPTHPFYLLYSADHWKEILRQKDMVQILTSESWERKLFANGDQLLRTLKAVGDNANGINQNIGITRQLCFEVISRYNQLYWYRTRDCVYATYHSIQIQGQKCDRSLYIQSSI